MLNKKQGGTLLWVVIIILVTLAVIFFLTQPSVTEPEPSAEPIITAPEGVTVEFEEPEVEPGDEERVEAEDETL
ncbi:hypothetical protein KJ910_01945 [Patescibacteria group bacterium]|nr:hypothetical protein [Patescibacteria group bacterium]MBU1907456.1 hypothetical protein [Patescibacteria group bacterium]